MKFLTELKASRLFRKIADRGGIKQRTFDGYEDRLPTNQNAVDILPGWNMSFPTSFNVQAGTLPLFADDRIHWAIERFGEISGRRVLELGPLNAGHTVMLDQAGAKIEAIEANKKAYLMCLITKEIFGLSNAKFYLGDFVKWLEQIDTSYDLIVASGVLYHMLDPLRLLRAIAMRTEALYLWTLCVTNDTLTPSKVVSINEVPIRLYLQSYENIESNDDFCGGMENEHYLMHRDDILAALKALGFSSLTLAHENPDHLRGGPTFSVFARKISG
jgi:hypothetical protein